MVQVSVNSGSTIETARMLVALIHDVGKECIADITEYGRESPLRKLWDERPRCFCICFMI